MDGLVCGHPEKQPWQLSCSLALPMPHQMVSLHLQVICFQAQATIAALLHTGWSSQSVMPSSAHIKYGCLQAEATC
jgi:hypothetical protein